MDYYNDRNRLFSEAHLDAYLRDQGEKLKAHIQSLDLSKIQTEEEANLKKELVDRYSAHTPILLENQIKVDAHEADVTIRGDSGFLHDRGQTFVRKGLNITVNIPFNGTAELFHLRPSTYSMSGTPSANVNADRLVINYETTEKEPEKIKQLWLSDIGEIKKHLGWIDKDVANYNQSLQSIVQNLISQRKQESASNQSLIDAIKQG